MSCAEFRRVKSRVEDDEVVVAGDPPPLWEDAAPEAEVFEDSSKSKSASQEAGLDKEEDVDVDDAAAVERPFINANIPNPPPPPLLSPPPPPPPLTPLSPKPTLVRFTTELYKDSSMRLSRPESVGTSLAGGGGNDNDINEDDNNNALDDGEGLAIIPR